MDLVCCPWSDRCLIDLAPNGRQVRPGVLAKSPHDTMGGPSTASACAVDTGRHRPGPAGRIPRERRDAEGRLDDVGSAACQGATPFGPRRVGGCRSREIGTWGHVSDPGDRDAGVCCDPLDRLPQHPSAMDDFGQAVGPRRAVAEPPTFARPARRGPAPGRRPARGRATGCGDEAPGRAPCRGARTQGDRHRPLRTTTAARSPPSVAQGPASGRRCLGRAAQRGPAGVGPHHVHDRGACRRRAGRRGLTGGAAQPCTVSPSGVVSSSEWCLRRRVRTRSTAEEAGHAVAAFHAGYRRPCNFRLSQTSDRGKAGRRRTWPQHEHGR